MAGREVKAAARMLAFMTRILIQAAMEVMTHIPVTIPDNTVRMLATEAAMTEERHRDMALPNHRAFE